jgi:hypothetical protein
MGQMPWPAVPGESGQSRVCGFIRPDWRVAYETAQPAQFSSSGAKLPSRLLVAMRLGA